MSKKTRADSTDASTFRARAPALAPVVLIALGVAEALLALFQWMELLLVRSGGSTVCGINDVINCQKVWDTDFASAVHHFLGVPVAGLGVAWGLAATAVSLAWTHDLLTGKGGDAAGAGLKLLGLAGVLASIVFAIVSFRASALCLTCLATYVLVLVFAIAAWRLVPGGAVPSGSSLKGGLVWAVGAVVVAYLVVLGPGIATPHRDDGGAERLKGFTAASSGPSSGHAPDAGAPATASQPASGATAPRPLTDRERDLVEFLRQVPDDEKQQLANLIGIYRAQPKPEGELPPPREGSVQGSKDAPVKLVEWVDIRCPHCRALNEGLHELMRAAPPGSFSIEARAFPLAQECNPNVPRPDPTGVNCTAAKALICLEGTKDFWTIRDALFSAQQELTSVDKVLDIATSTGTNRAELKRCIDSPETKQKLDDDVKYAMRYDPHGTPIVTVNGKEAVPVIPLLFALVMTEGDPSSPAFNVLPMANLDAMGGRGR